MSRVLTMTIKKWCHENNIKCKVRKGNDFACFVSEEIIQYGNIMEDNQDKLFRQVFFDEGLIINHDIFILSLMHEIGHLMTDDNWSDRQSLNFMKRKSRLDGNKDKDNMKYFYMPDEIMASRWAIDFINNHENEIEDLWNKIKELVK